MIKKMTSSRYEENVKKKKNIQHKEPNIMNWPVGVIDEELTSLTFFCAMAFKDTAVSEAFWKNQNFLKLGNQFDCNKINMSQSSQLYFQSSIYNCIITQKTKVITSSFHSKQSNKIYEQKHKKHQFKPWIF